MSAVTHLSSRPQSAAVAEVPRRHHLHLVPQPAELAPVRSSRTTYARRRFAVVLALVVVLAGAVMAGRAMASSGGGLPDEVVTVQPGETLSGIAARELPSVSNGQAVVLIQLANHLGSTEVTAGRQLVIPHD